MSIRDTGSTVEIGCSECGAGTTFPTEPVSTMLKSLEDFVAQHGGCAFRDRQT